MKKTKVVPVYAMKEHRESRSIAPLNRNLVIIQRSVVKFTTCPFFAPGKKAGIHSTGGLVDHRSCPDVLEKIKTTRPCLKSNRG
jgi:hypothetical protein